LLCILILSTLRIPLEVFSIHFDNSLQHIHIVLRHELPIPRCSLSSICPLDLWLGPLNSSSFLGINPSYLFLQWLSQLFSKVTNVAENLNNKLSNQKTTTTNQNTYPKVPASFSLILPFMLHVPSLLPNHLQCSSLLHHPSHNAVPILHNTQINKIAYPCIPCSNDGEIPAIRMQKDDS
jgi:hypothetical protein